MSSTYIDQRLIILNSDNATQNNGTFLSDVKFTFIGLIQQNDPDIEEITIQVQNAQIPISFYNINVYNNILNITYNSTPYSLTLTRGNYNSTTLINEIIAKLATFSITDITITISSITGLLTFTRAASLNFTINSTGTLNKVLGFVVGTTYTSVGGILTAPFPLNLLGLLKLKIASDELNVNNYDSSVNGSLNILATIPIEAGSFGLILYDNISNTQSVLNNPILDGFDLKIYGDDNNLVNFNNCPWQITLLLSITRRRNEKSNTIFSKIVQPINQIDPTFLDNELKNTTVSQQPQDNLGDIPQQSQDNLEDIPQQTHEATSAPAEDLGDSSLDLLLYNQHTYL
jgi:hypothetical protein